MMQKSYLIVYLFFIGFYFQNLSAQNYLRVADPDIWWPNSDEDPDWHQWVEHGQFDEVRVVVHPQGVFNQIELFVTISQGDAAFAWEGEYEVVWQFQLPEHTIVHDSWLWVEQDIIKADVVDYWTALQTYEEIVDRNRDPSFLYRLPDQRHEMRIYPLFEGESRKIKMSFLVPAEWSVDNVKGKLLNHLFEGTDIPLPTVEICTPVAEDWSSPQLGIGTDHIPMEDTIASGTGGMLHYMELEGHKFLSETPSVVWDNPLSSQQQTYVSTLTDGEDSFFQVVYLPSWPVTSGIIDYQTNLKDGIAFQRYTLSDFELNDHNQGVFMQVGKFIGDFPLKIEASLIADDGGFYSQSLEVESTDFFEGDSLMREMWYGSFLREQEAQIDSDEDRLSVIAQSIEERVLTGLTAFLALEPGLGGEPCVSCLNNNGGVLIATNELYDFSGAELTILPNPVFDQATIQLEVGGDSPAVEWTMMIYDVAGRMVANLGSANSNENLLQWDWILSTDISEGIYFCKAKSIHGELITKVIVLPR